MSSTQERYPEAMALADLANATADSARTLWFGFIAFGTFLALAVFGTSHRDLFLANPLALPPPISIEIDLVGFYVVAPFLLLTIHVYLLVKLVLLARVHTDFEAQLRADVRLANDRAQARKHLNTTLFLRTLSAWQGEEEIRAGSWLMLGLLIGSLVLIPIAVLIFTWINFLPYQSEEVTMVHRVLFAIDVAAVVFAFRSITRANKAIFLTGLVYASAVVTTLAASAIFTFPQECWGKTDSFCLDKNPLLRMLGVTRTVGFYKPQIDIENTIVAGIETTALRWPETTIQLANEDFVDDLKIATLSKLRFTHNLRERSLVGADLANTDLRKIALVGADLRATNFAEADLRESDFSNTKMHGSNLAKAKLQLSDFSNASMELTKLDSSQLQNAEFVQTLLYGASFRFAKVQGGKFSGAKLEGADLSFAHMHGADFRSALAQGVKLIGTKLQGANLIRTNLLGVNLHRAQLQGANLSGAKLSGAYLYRVTLVGAKLDNTDMSGAVAYRTAIWRTDPSKIKGEPLVFWPILDRPKGLEQDIRFWLDTIPSGNTRNRATKNLGSLTTEPKQGSEEQNKYWQSWDLTRMPKPVRDVKFQIHREKFRKVILDYACSKKRSVEFAISRMTSKPTLFEALFRFSFSTALPGVPTYVKSVSSLAGILANETDQTVGQIRAQIKECRS